MFNSTYGAGYRAGMAQPKTQQHSDGTKTLITPRCPFSPWRVISFTLWGNGYYDGLTKRLAQAISRPSSSACAVLSITRSE